MAQPGPRNRAAALKAGAPNQDNADAGPEEHDIGFSRSSLRVHPTSRSVSFDLTEDGQRIEAGPQRSVDVQLLPKLHACVRVHERTLDALFDRAAAEMMKKPVAQGEHYVVWLHDVVLRPVAGGVSIACSVDAELHAALTTALHLEPHARGDVWVATAPLWVEAGNVFVKVEGVDVQPSSEYGRVVSAAFTWLKNAINLDDMLQRALQTALDRELNGKSLLELVSSGRTRPPGQGQGQGQGQAQDQGQASNVDVGAAASGAAGQPASTLEAAEEGHAIGPLTASRQAGLATTATTSSGNTGGTADGHHDDVNARRLGSDGALAPRLHQTPSEAAAAEATVGQQPTLAGDAAAAAAHGPPPAVVEALELVDLSTARGGIMTSETGDLVLEVRFGPTDRARRMLRWTLIAGAVVLAVIVAIILIATLSNQH